MARPSDQALVASPSNPQAVSTEGFDPSRVIKAMSSAQKRWLETVCHTNGGGVNVAHRVTDEGEVVPSNGPLRKLYDKGLIQGKAGAYGPCVVHTREGWAVRNALANQEQPK